MSLQRLQRLVDDGRLTRLATGIYAPTAEVADLDRGRSSGSEHGRSPRRTDRTRTSPQAREFDLRRRGLDLARYDWPDVFPSRPPLGRAAGRERELLESRRPTVRTRRAGGAGAVAA